MATDSNTSPTCYLTAVPVLWVFPAVLLPSGISPVLNNLPILASARTRILTPDSLRHCFRQGTEPTVSSTNG
ncbi:hypothetical protein K501DRAFT_286913 [Backusella circina FSU 941]|nr:hypothetical protein K501DRAFT_286913 [Backusella circina FSU 941]